MNWRLADQGDLMAVMRRAFAFPLFALFAWLLASAAFAQSTPAPADATPPAPAAVKPAPAKPAPAPRIEFNHNQTGFQLTGAHILARCETCHIQGIFKGTPKDCASCHLSGGRAATLNTVLKPTDHISVTSGSACEACHQSTSQFSVWRMDHTLTTATCSACHSGQSFNGTTFTAKGSQHISTMADCKICHTSTNSFLPPFVSRFDHIDVAPGTCNTCHNGATAMGKPPAHMPTGSRSCDECHTMPLSGDLVGTFATWRMDHTGITSNCASCHNGRTFVGIKNSQPLHKPTNHIPVTSDCSVCHFDTTVPGGFVNWSQPMDHSTAAIGSSSCATCHGAGKTFIGSPTVVTLPTGSGAHIPTTKTCDTCHYKDHVQPYSSFANWTMDHTGITSGCQTCHGTTTQLFPGVMNQNAGHPDTTALKLPDCVSCHTVTTPGGFGTFSYNGSANFNPHLPPAYPNGGVGYQGQSRCDNCHGSSGPIKAPGIVMGHIPFNSGTDCGTCHSSIIASFAKLTLSSDEHASVTLSSCETCHASGKSFPGLGTPIKTPASVKHIPLNSGASCVPCHSATSKASGGFGGRDWTTAMDHTYVNTASCNACHAKPANSGFTSTTPLVIKTTSNQAYAGGGHIPVTSDCVVCHSKTYGAGDFNTSWTMGSTGHSAVNTGSCSGCHAKSVADYVFAPSVPVIGALTTNVGYASSGIWFHRTAGNAPTSECNSCHGSLTTFLGATSAHKHVAADAGNCISCHGGSGGGGKGMITNHITTSAQCDACHTTWNTAANLANETGVFAACSTNPKSCMGAAGHAKVSATCTDCHKSTGNQSITGGTATVTVVGTPTKHIPMANNAACDTCHGKVYTSFARSDWPTAMKHNSAVIDLSACKTCHGSTVYNTFTATPALSIKPIPAGSGSAGHIPVSAGSDCLSCHSNGNYNVGGFTQAWSGTTMNHTSGVIDPSSCSVCHAKGVADYTYATGVKVIGSQTTSAPYSANPWHTLTGKSPTADCTQCHTSTTTFLEATGYTHLGTETGKCLTCHNGSGGGRIKIPNHIATTATASCDACHTTWFATGANVSGRFGDCSISPSPNSCMGSTGHALVTGACNSCHISSGIKTITGGSQTVTIKSVGSVTHIPVVASAACESCHTKTYTSFARGDWPTAMVHTAAVIAVTRCDACHGASKTYDGATIKTINSAGVSHIPVTGDCVSCHGNIYTSFAKSSSAWVAASATIHASGNINIGSCDTCHKSGNNSYTSLTIRTTPTQAVGPNASGHIPVTGDCGLCHRSGNYTTSGFTQSWTGANMQHGAVSVGNCSDCHARAVADYTFASGVKVIGSQTSPPPAGTSAFHTVGANAPTGDCAGCHSSFTTFAGAVGGGHTGTDSHNCSTCHKTGGSGKAKIANHVATIAECDYCHTSSYKATTAASMGGFADCSTNAASCMSTSSKHSLMTAYTTCNTCHKTTGDSTITGGTSTVSVKGQLAGHLAYTAGTQCSSCHTSANSTFAAGSFAQTWTGGSFGGHSYLVNGGKSTCNSCHTGQSFPTGVTPVAKGTSPPHITTAQQCDVCHNTSNNTTTFANVPTFTAAMHSANGNATAGCSVCHNNVAGVAKVFQGVSPKPLPAAHITTTQTCETCHKSTTTFAGQNVGWVMSHTGNTLPCSSCHNGQTFTTSVIPVNVTTHYIGAKPHIPLTTLSTMAGNAGIECSVCHTSTTSFLTEKMNHGTMKGGINPGGCATCHNSTANYLGSQQKKTLGNHEGSKTTDDCSKSGCHKPLGNRGTAYTSW
jgi:hypothetical protein